MLSSAEILAIVELIFYIPFFILSVGVCIRHGFRRSSGWIYTLILCIVRIAGSICLLVQHSDHSAGLIQATFTLESIGLSPLLLATLGMLSRFVDFINAQKSPKFTAKHFRIVQLVVMIGLILSIVGGNDTKVQADGTVSVAETSKAGIILILIAYVAIVAIFFLSIWDISVVPSKERRVPIAILIALPFIFVRLLYSVLSVFLHNHLFSVISGSVAIHAGMAVAEEFVVVATYVLLGLFVDRLSAETQGPIVGRRSKARNDRGMALPQWRTQGADEHQNVAYKNVGPDPSALEQQYGVTR